MIDAPNCPGLFRLVPAFFGLGYRAMSGIDAIYTADDRLVFPDFSAFFRIFPLCGADSRGPVTRTNDHRRMLLYWGRNSNPEEGPTP